MLRFFCHNQQQQLMSPNTGHMGNKNAYTTDPTKIKQGVNEGNRAGCSIDFYLEQFSNRQSMDLNISA